ncbi:MAG: restriction endonuclease subunit R, partial [Bacteroidetes bacterium]|nr:restriction endonuclease subunit R [Bacteroidota bacterium]
FPRRGIDMANYPAIFNYLKQFKEQLMPRPKDWQGKEWKGRKPGKYKWYEIQDAVDYYGEFEKPKIIYQVFQVKPCFVFDTNNHYTNNAIWIIPEDDKKLLAILNSKLGWYLISKNCTQIQNGYQLIYKYIEKVVISLADKPEINRLVASLITLNDQKNQVKLSTELDQIQGKIDYCEERINRMVYELYGLTEEEINIIERK